MQVTMRGALWRDAAQLTKNEKCATIIQAFVSPDNLPHMFVQAGEHVGLPRSHAQVNKAVALRSSMAHRRVDLNSERLTEPLHLCRESLFWCDGVVICGEY